VNAARETVEAKLGRIEFTMILSMLMAATALAIDLMLPAFGVMRQDFGLASDSNAIAPVVTFFFLGLALGQLFWGPLSDALGRKHILYAGLAVYIAGAVGAAFAPSLGFLFAMRFIGGLGAAGTRVIAISVVRDTYEGEQMAKVMSYVMALFILIPIIAPTIGAGLLTFGSWQFIFLVIAGFGIAVGLWALRLPETLERQRRIPLDISALSGALATVGRNRFTMGLTLARTALFAFFASYLASSQLIIDDIFGLDDWFPVIFASMAAVTGFGMLVNARLLDRFSLRTIIRTVLTAFLFAAALFVAMAIATGGTPPFWLFMVTYLPIVACNALMIPNLNSAAMIPMGAVAGTAAAVTGTVSTLGGAVFGAGIDSLYNGTITPFAVSGAVMVSIAYGFYRWADKIWDKATVEHQSV
jgi:DHA1 family bicyclomycin/chloramphenicol resistance-like MFS transporter